MNKIFFLIILIISLPCYSQSNFSEVKIGHVYYVSLPEYLTEATDLNKDASLQYQNTVKVAYVIVIEDPKKSLKEAGMVFQNPLEFYDYFAKNFLKEDAIVNKPKELKINGNKAVQVEVQQYVEETDIFYLITVIETKTYFYKMLAWTIPENKDKLIDDFKKIANSFKE
jgi:hypothetical protein